MIRGNVDVELVVREVMRRLQAMKHGSGGATTVAAQRSQPTTGDSGVLRVRGNLATLAGLDGQLANLHTVVVSDKAVVTPAFLDQLRTSGIQLVRQTANESPQCDAQVLIACYATEWNLNDWLAGQGARLAHAERIESDCIDEITDQLQAALQSSKQLGIVFTQQPAKASCVANRKSGIRAAVAFDQDAVVDAMETLNCNVLVVPPRGKSPFAIRKLVELFVGRAST